MEYASEKVPFLFPLKHLLGFNVAISHILVGRREHVEAGDHKQVVDGCLEGGPLTVFEARPLYVPTAQRPIDRTAKEAARMRIPLHAELHVLGGDAAPQLRAGSIPEADGHVRSGGGNLVDGVHVTAVDCGAAVAVHVCLHQARGAVQPEAPAIPREASDGVYWWLQIHKFLHDVLVLVHVVDRAGLIRLDAVDSGLVAPHRALVDEVV